MENTQKYNIVKAEPQKINLKEIFTISSVPVFLASLCCLSPVLLLSFGFVSLTVASELADVLYGTYKWVFRGVGLVALCVIFVMYLRRTGVCTLDEVKKRRQEIINKAIILITVSILGYVFFLYVVVHYIGVFLSIWK
jgi:amino acid transporter